MDKRQSKGNSRKKKIYNSLEECVKDYKKQPVGVRPWKVSFGDKAFYVWVQTSTDAFRATSHLFGIEAVPISIAEAFLAISKEETNGCRR